MNVWKAWGCLVIVAVLAWSITLTAQAPDAPGTESTKLQKPPAKPAIDADDDDEEEAEESEEPNVLVPVDKITTLTGEQMRKLREIAAKLEEDKRALIEKAREESFALLTREQKAELAAYKEKARAAAAERRAEAARQREARLKAKEEKARLKAEKKAKAGGKSGASGEPSK